MSDVPVLDTAVLERLRDLGGQDQPDFAAEILTMFLDDAPRHMAAIADASASGDASALERAAHTLKGAVANIGALQVQAACARLEQQGRDGHVAEAVPEIARLREEYDTLCQHVRQILSA